MDDLVVSKCLLAGGSPAASHFLCLVKESNPRKTTPLRHPFGAGLD